MKRTLTMGLLVFLLLGAVSCANADMRSYEKGRGYEYVTLGAYPYEADGTEKPVLWRVLSAENGQALLLTEYIIDAKQIIFETNARVIENHTFRRISAYDESDLYAWLNTEGLDTLLGDDPLRGALLEEPGLGRLFPLPQEQYMNVDNGFERGQWGEEVNAYPRRQCTCTPYAAAQGLYVDYRNLKSPYWCVAIKDKTDYKFGLVGYNGHISWGAYTNGKVGGLRLAVRLDLDLLEIASGTGVKEDPYALRYTGAEATLDHIDRAFDIRYSVERTDRRRFRRNGRRRVHNQSHGGAEKRKENQPIGPACFTLNIYSYYNRHALGDYK